MRELVLESVQEWKRRGSFVLIYPGKSKVYK